MTTTARASARAIRLAALAALSVVLAAVVSTGLAPGAHAVAYRFWSYWQASGGTWTFSQAGPGAVLPADGSVEGWHFGVTTEAGTGNAAPRVEPSFDALCADTAPVEGSKRVGVVIDFGDPAEAPNGEVPPALVAGCALVPLDANGYAVVESLATVRTDSGGMVCGIGGFPARECWSLVEDASPAPSPAAASSSTTSIDTSDFGMATPGVEDTADASPMGMLVSAMVIGVIAVLGFAAWRRRQSS